MQRNIPKGAFKLRNKKRVYITYSEDGHYTTNRGGELLMKDILDQKPECVLVEKNPKKSAELSPDLIKNLRVKSKIKKIGKSSKNSFML